MKKSIMAVLVSLPVLFSASTQAANQWNFNYAQGMSEIVSTDKATGTQVAFSCGDPKGEGFLTLGVTMDYKGNFYSDNSDTGEYVSVYYGGDEYVINDSNAGMSNWFGFFEDLQKGKSDTVTFGVKGKTPKVSFSAKELKKIFLENKDNQCFR